MLLFPQSNGSKTQNWLITKPRWEPFCKIIHASPAPGRAQGIFNFTKLPRCFQCQPDFGILGCFSTNYLFDLYIRKNYSKLTENNSGQWKRKKGNSCIVTGDGFQVPVGYKIHITLQFLRKKAHPLIYTILETFLNYIFLYIKLYTTFFIIIRSKILSF